MGIGDIRPLSVRKIPFEENKKKQSFGNASERLFSS
jgi:hypothetical protein